MMSIPSAPTPAASNQAFVPDVQVSQLTVTDCSGANTRVIYESSQHIEAPNWSPDGAWLLVNGGGRLYRIAIEGGVDPELIEIHPTLHANNDHVLSPDGKTIYFTVRGGQLYRVPWQGGDARRVSNVHPVDVPRRYFLHDVSSDGETLLYVGLSDDPAPPGWGLYTIPACGGPDRTILLSGVPLDGPEYSQDGRWIYYNGEQPDGLAGHAQIYRLQVDDRKIEQLTDDDRVNWFPHPSPDGEWMSYLSYPTGTLGHPANLPVEIRVARADGRESRTVATLLGGQGTLNVNSWSPDSERLAFVAYPEICKA